jgi:hypothetical protein
MSSDQEQQRPPRKSFSNGNAGPDDGPQMEGWLIRPAHWWLM